MLILKTIVLFFAIFLTFKIVAEIITTWKTGRDVETKYVAFISCILWALFYYLTQL